MQSGDVLRCRHDRSGLGAGHEARLRDRHQSRRPHLPRGDHRARARHSRGRRLRRCDRATIRRGPGRNGILRRRRHGLRLRRAAARSSRRQIELDSLPQMPVKIMMNVGNPGPCVRLRRHPEQRRGPRAARVHHQPHDRRASARAARVRPAETRDLKDTIRRQMAGYTDPVSFYVDKLCEGIAHDRRRLCARAGDRAALGLQVERVRQPDRRPRVRAVRGEPDARVPRRLTLRRRGVPAVLRARVPRAEARAQRDGAHQRAGHGAVRAHAEGSGAGRRSCWRRTASSAARTASRSS